MFVHIVEIHTFVGGEQENCAPSLFRLILPHVLSQVGPDNIIIVAARTKIEALDHRRLLVDTGDEKLDQSFRGYRRVLTGYQEEVVVGVE